MGMESSSGQGASGGSGLCQISHVCCCGRQAGQAELKVCN